MDAHDFAPPNVIAENVQVRYTVGTNDPGQRSYGMQRVGDWMLGRQGRTIVRALRGVNLVAREGEMVGIVGPNGSGKSTFLRNVAGVEQPDRGRILVRYQPLLLGVQAALQPALSGAENVHLGCLAMGLTPDETAEAFDYVVELSALGSAIHRPMGTYSAGMGGRLRFAIALAARPRILLIDEALSTGDASFAERSERAMHEMLSEAGTVFMVNHAAEVIQKLCTRAVWMHQGELVMDGPAEAIAERYRWWAWNVAQGKEYVAESLLLDVVRNADKEEISVLEPEEDQDPIPRHAIRRAKKRKSPRHAKRQSLGEENAQSLDLPLNTSVPRICSEERGADYTRAELPVLPKPAAEAVGAKVRGSNEPIYLRPRDRPIVLRAADPRDSTAATIAEEDLAGRRLQARADDTKRHDRPMNGHRVSKEISNDQS